MCFQKTHNKRSLHSGSSHCSKSRMWIHEDDAPSDSRTKCNSRAAVVQRGSDTFCPLKDQCCFLINELLKSSTNSWDSTLFLGTFHCYGIRTLSQPNTFCFVRLSWHQIWRRIHRLTACSVPAPTQHHQTQQHSAAAKPLSVQYLTRLF